MTQEPWSHPLMAMVSNIGGSARSFYGLLNLLEEGNIVIPPWQRGRVWTPEQKTAWVGFVLSRMPLPAIWLRQVNTEAGRIRDELLDGQQRLLSLLEWTRGDFAAVLPWNGAQVWCRTDRDRRRLNRLTIPCLELPPETTDAQAVRLYLDLNTTGTPHTAADLERAEEWLTRRGA